MHLFQNTTFPNFLLQYIKGQKLNLQEFKCITILKNIFDFHDEFFHITDIKLLDFNYDTGNMQIVQISLPSESYTYSNYTHGFSVNTNAMEELDKPFILHLYTKGMKNKISNNSPYAVAVFGQEYNVHNIIDNREEPMCTWLKNIPKNTVGRFDIIIPSVKCLSYFESNVSFLKPFTSSKIFNKLNDRQSSVLLARNNSIPQKIVRTWEKPFIFQNYVKNSIKNCNNNFKFNRQSKYCSQLILESEVLKYSACINYNPYKEKSYVSLSNTYDNFPYIKRKFIGKEFKDGDPIAFWIPQGKAIYSVQEGSVYPDLETFAASCGARSCAVDILLLDYDILEQPLPEILK